MNRQIELLQIGSDIGRDVEVMRRLYCDDGIDFVIEREFSATVEAYRSLSESEVEERLRARYGGSDSQAVSTVAIIDGEPAGTVLSGPKDFLFQRTDCETVEMRGINLSMWVLGRYRGQGLGSLLVREGLKNIDAVVASGRDSWQNRTVWTSIRWDNVASQKACLSGGFECAHRQLEVGKQDRLVYTLE